MGAPTPSGKGYGFMKGLAYAAAALGLLMQAAAAQAPVWDGKTWLVEDIRGRGVIDNAQTTLRIAADGAASGSTGCNFFHGSATVSGESLRFGQMAATLRACPPAIADQERKFLDALRDARRARLDAVGKLLILSEKGETLLRLSRTGD
jgi:putative lipoprotein